MSGDPFGPARGILAGIAVGSAIWIVVFYLAVFA